MKYLNPICLPVILAITCFQSNIAIGSEVFRWVDENGEVHFGDKRQKPKFAEKIEMKTDTAHETTDQRKRLKKQKHLLSVIDEERKIKQQQEAEEKKKKLERQKKCQRARKTLVDYEGSPLYDLDEKGNKVYLSELEREQEVKRVQDAIKYWCN